MAHYFRQGTTIVAEPLRDYATPGAGDYYLVPRDAAKEVLLEPTPFKDGDKEVLKTTIVVPILDKGKVAGVVGIDFTLQSLSELLAKQKISAPPSASVRPAPRGSCSSPGPPMR